MRCQTVTFRFTANRGQLFDDLAPLTERSDSQPGLPAGFEAVYSEPEHSGDAVLVGQPKPDVPG
jgi:hypothetical protein